MRERVEDAVEAVIPFIDAVGAIVLVVGVAIAFVTWAMSELRIRRVEYNGIRLTLGRYLALALEFQLGADILETAVSPTYDDIGKLAAIATIRTALNYFLSRELAQERRETALASSPP